MAYSKKHIEIPSEISEYFDFNDVATTLHAKCHCVALDTDLLSYISVDAHRDCMESTVEIINLYIGELLTTKSDVVDGYVESVDKYGNIIHCGDKVVVYSKNANNNKVTFEVGLVNKIYTDGVGDTDLIDVYIEDNLTFITVTSSGLIKVY